MPTVKELRTELGKRGLSADGRKAELEERLGEVERRENKRARLMVNSVADEWLCPITTELPVDPVVAEDGNTYERTAIAKWVEENPRSPITGAAMGTRLISSPKVRNTIEKLVESGLVDAEKGAAWKKKMEDEQWLKMKHTEADQGDANAMYLLAHVYDTGKRSLAQDFEQARVWYERAAELDNVKSMAKFGEFLTKGLGGPSIPVLGVLYIGRAAESGSDFATYQLGKAFMKGRYGLPQDNAKAKRYFCKVVEHQCEIKDVSSAVLEKAKQYVEQL